VQRRSIALLVVTVGLAGCGNSRTAPPTLTTPQPSGGLVRHAFTAAGFSIGTPTSWSTTAGSAPLLSVVSGSATIAVWRYPRTNPHLPRSNSALKRALTALLRAVRARDATFSLVHARVAPVAHRGGLEIVGLETIDGQRREVRSTHFFVRRAEVVVDEYAPPNVFPAVDRATFLPVVHSLRAGSSL
jgi:hypothetical protein